MSFTKEKMLRLSGILFLVAAVAFCFSPMRWMALVEAAAGIMMLIAAARAAEPRQTPRRRRR